MIVELNITNVMNGAIICHNNNVQDVSDKNVRSVIGLGQEGEMHC